MWVLACCQSLTARRVGTLGVLLLLAGYGFLGAIRGGAIAPQNTQMEPTNQHIVRWSSQVQPLRDQWAAAQRLGYFGSSAKAYSQRRAIMNYVLLPGRLVDRRFTRWMLLDLADDAAVADWTQKHQARLRVRLDTGLALVEQWP